MIQTNKEQKKLSAHAYFGNRIRSDSDGVTKGCLFGQKKEGEALGTMTGKLKC